MPAPSCLAHLSGVHSAVRRTPLPFSSLLCCLSIGTCKPSEPSQQQLLTRAQTHRRKTCARSHAPYFVRRTLVSTFARTRVRFGDCEPPRGCIRPPASHRQDYRERACRRRGKQSPPALHCHSRACSMHSAAGWSRCAVPSRRRMLQSNALRETPLSARCSAAESNTRGKRTSPLHRRVVVQPI